MLAEATLIGLGVLTSLQTHMRSETQIFDDLNQEIQLRPVTSAWGCREVTPNRLLSRLQLRMTSVTNDQ